MSPSIVVIAAEVALALRDTILELGPDIPPLSAQQALSSLGLDLTRDSVHFLFRGLIQIHDDGKALWILFSWYVQHTGAENLNKRDHATINRVLRVYAREVRQDGDPGGARFVMGWMAENSVPVDKWSWVALLLANKRWGRNDDAISIAKAHAKGQVEWMDAWRYMRARYGEEDPVVKALGAAVGPVRGPGYGDAESDKVAVEKVARRTEKKPAQHGARMQDRTEDGSNFDNNTSTNEHPEKGPHKSFPRDDVANDVATGRLSGTQDPNILNRRSRRSPLRAEFPNFVDTGGPSSQSPNTSNDRPRQNLRRDDVTNDFDTGRPSRGYYSNEKPRYNSQWDEDPKDFDTGRPSGSHHPKTSNDNYVDTGRPSRSYHPNTSYDKPRYSSRRDDDHNDVARTSQPTRPPTLNDFRQTQTPGRDRHSDRDRGSKGKFSKQANPEGIEPPLPFENRMDGTLSELLALSRRKASPGRMGEDGSRGGER
ncbi:uncharacterized protein EV422DRAFT_572101 [Fimicolochytrium jonesii]|uniref:uncharacterized protein n=1 Tax=Fimicolochytrium jonesii TaxID=1396493 RepID=UPI0022FF2075|nr:uncharacterized protein EV422DRAFT_572101 [Fimicolochytrium jonesii]KAI8816040.1 hypothetical protein EV422DRAFT_572101 [Fimicolochytrium jonesii]